MLNEYNCSPSRRRSPANMSEDFLRQKNKWLPKIKQWIEQERPGEKMVFYSAALEQKFLEMTDEEKAKFIEENKTRSQIGKIVVEGYHTLQLIHFYTSGPDECRCWTIREGWLAPKAAGTIHTGRPLTLPLPHASPRLRPRRVPPPRRAVTRRALTRTLGRTARRFRARLYQGGGVQLHGLEGERVQ